MKQFISHAQNTAVLFLTGLLLSAGISKAQVSTYSFTPAGATGNVGPTQNQINTAYASTNLNGLVISNAGIQSWTVPVAGPYRVDAYGASGGSAIQYTPTGGHGAQMTGEFTFAQGDVITLIAGQKGTDNTGTGGGGGGSYVLLNGSILVIAGGGGGCSSDTNGVDGVIVTSGTADNPYSSNGGTNGDGGQACSGTPYNAGGGGGYNAGTNGDGQSATGGGNGGQSFLNGALGGSGNTPGGFGGGGDADVTTVGGGGGGGYSGGAGGMLGLSPCTAGLRSGGGGGGSINNGINQTNIAGANTGDGQVIITALCDVNIMASGTNSLFPAICNGQSLTLTTNAVSNYSWSTGGTTQSIIVSPTLTTTYTLTATSALSCSNTAMITVTVSNAVPALTLTASSMSVCQGNSVTLIGAGALTYSWSANASGDTIVVSPASTITYTLYGTNGCGTTNTTVAILVTPLPVVATTNTSTICSGSTVTLTATGATTYTWYPSGAATNPFVAGPSSSTIYTVIGQSGNCSTPATVAVNTNPIPSLTIVPSSTSICNGDAVTLNVNGNANSYTWSPNNQNSTSITENPTQTSVYSVEGINSFGCTNSSNIVILVHQGPSITVAVSSSVICSGNSATLAASGAATYSWSGISSGSSVVVNPTIDTTYMVTGTGPTGCSSTVLAGLSVFSPTILISSDVTALCLGGQANLTASGADTYSWSNGSNLQSITVSPITNTVYTVMGTATDVNSGLSCDGTNSIALSINPSPTVVAVASHSAICRGESDVLTASGAATYTWSGGSSPVMNATISVSPIANQTFSVEGINANGCRSAATLLIQVAPCTGISVNSSNNITVMIYPNPSNGEFTISSDQAITLQISNELGQQIRIVSLTDANREVKLNNLSNGIYFVKGKNENGSVMQKIIIAK